MSNGTERREFLKSAGATLGGITIAAVASTEAMAVAKGGGPDCKTARTLSFRCTPAITTDNIFEAIKRGLEQTGCTACGLLGIDLFFHVGEPSESINLQVAGIAEGNLE